MKKKLLKVIKIIFAVLVLFFLVRYFYINYEDIKQLDIKISPGVFAVSMLLYFVYKITLASLWHYITKLNGSAVGYKKAVTSYLYSILGKYIPGKVFMLAARFPAYEREGIPMRKVTICFLLENICTLLGAAFLFIVSLFFFPNDILKDYIYITAAMVAVFFVMINPRIINFFLKKIGKIIKKNDMEIQISYPAMLKVVVLFIGNWLIVGAGFYMLSASVYPLDASKLLYTGGIFGLSAIIGIISIFAPSGIGVREGIMILGLSLIMPEEYAVIISVVSRLWATVAELILIFIAFVFERLSDKRKKVL